jgi:hypothetical protein
MKKLEIPEIGDPSVNGSGGVSAEGAGARRFPGAPAVDEPSLPLASSCLPPPVLFDFGCMWVERSPGVLPCGRCARTRGAVVSTGALGCDDAGAGTVSVVVVAVLVDGAVAGASGAGVVVVAAAGDVVVVVSTEVVVPVDGDEAGGSLAPAAAGVSASAPRAPSSRRIAGRMSVCVVIV